jgi:type IV pilus assembly protein PilE
MILPSYKGFSLIECLLTLALIALFMSVIYPNYNTHIMSSARKQAETHLLQASNILEEHYELAGEYTGLSPTDLNLNNTTSDPYRYELSADTTHFALSAIPQGRQIKDHCGTLSVDQSNLHSPENSNCW